MRPPGPKVKLRFCGLLRMAWLCVPSALALLPFAASAQTLTCAPAPSREYGVVPVMQGPFADPALLLKLQKSYRELYIAHRPATLKAAQKELAQVLDSSLASKNRCAEALAAYALGGFAERNDFAGAATWFEQALSAFTAVASPLGIAKTHLRLATIHDLQGHEESAHREYIAAAKELEDAGDPADAIGARLGDLDSPSDHPDVFLALQQKARDLGDLCVEADVLRSWGDRAHREAKYQSAMDHYQAADRLYAHCPNNAADRAALQTSMGRLERQQGRPAAALPHYRLALRLQRQSGDPSYIPQTYNAMAVAYEAMNDLPHAIALYKLGLAEARRLHSQPFIDFLSANLGSTYARSGHPALGIPLLETATRHLTSDYLVCIRFDQLGSAYRDAGRYHEAAARFDTAVAACEREATKDSLADALSDRALSEMRSDRLDAAWADAHRALDIVEEFRAHLVQTDAYKRGYITAAQTRSTYDLAITILMRMKRYDEALQVAEQGRARALLDLLASEQSGATHASSTSAAIGAIASPEHTGALNVQQMLEEATRLHSTLLAYWLTKDDLYIWVARPGEPILGFTEGIHPGMLEHLIQETLPESAANTHHASRPSPAQRPAIGPPAPVHTPLQVIAGRGQSSEAGAVSLAAWRRLYALLIAPVAAALPSDEGALLTIIPSGPLFRVSFAALLDPHGHYLVERYRTHTIPMVGLLRYTEKNEIAASSLPAHYLFIAAPNHLPAGPDGLTLPPLPGTAAEVHNVAALLPSRQVSVLSGDEALPARVEREAPQATFLHFATHAIVDSEHPEKSYLALDAAHSSGRFTLDDIYALHLHARMVVLSACSTGLGKITGDGVAGLSRAFFYAGSASVLTTLWDVADEPTATMLPRFYRALQQGDSPSEALRTSQLSMLRDLRHHRIQVETLRGPVALPPLPIYWAAFSLSGEP